MNKSKNIREKNKRSRRKDRRDRRTNHPGRKAPTGTPSTTRTRDSRRRDLSLANRMNKKRIYKNKTTCKLWLVTLQIQISLKSRKLKIQGSTLLPITDKMSRPAKTKSVHEFRECSSCRFGSARI